MTTAPYLLYSRVFISMKKPIFILLVKVQELSVINQYIYGSYFLYIRAKPDTHFIYFVIFLTIPVRYFPRDVLLVGILSS
jgi:hypothetical protein